MSRCILENMDAVEFLSNVDDDYVDLFILDPPFGIGESTFSGKATVSGHVDGYVEAPKDKEGYYIWCKRWLTEVFRCMKKKGTCYIVSGWTNLCALMRACDDVGFTTLNHIIWHYNSYIIPTKNKFSTSHYHILRLGKSEKGQTFNVPQDNDITSEIPEGRNGKKSTYDKMDVWIIHKKPRSGEHNSNSLPDELVDKMILYSSSPGDLICDVFMGNFTTAYCAKRLDRYVIGCDINPEVCKLHIEKLMTQ